MPAPVDKLSSLPLFSGLDEAALEAIAERADPFDAPAGHILVQPGTVGAGLFVIEAGSVTLTLHDRDIELGPGEIVGELALLDDRAKRTTRVRVSKPVRGYCIDRDDFERLLAAQPTFALALLKVLAARLVDVSR